jgi:2-succinyl-5-enolpyruvyl-6-hydroxy-3-cyclohexene-1-carboxylate synthase
LSKTAAKQATWLNQWQEADAAARKVLDDFLDSLQVPFEARVARDLAGHIPQGGLLLVGNSKPVRELEASMAPREGLRVLANRGASGIDGLVSTAMGAGAVTDATYALIGDLSLLHDLSGLAWCRSPITIVVPNDRGGGIFDLVGDVSLPEHEAIFATPHELDLGALAHACQIDYSLVEGSDISQALAAPAQGPRLVEVAIDRKQALAIRRELDLAIASALG